MPIDRPSNRGYVLLPLVGTSPPPTGADPRKALHTGGQAKQSPLPAAVEATTRMTYRPSSSQPQLLGPWLSDHADPGALTIAFVERAVRRLRGSSKHRRILSISEVGTAESGAWLRVSDCGSRPRGCRRQKSWLLRARTGSLAPEQVAERDALPLLAHSSSDAGEVETTPLRLKRSRQGRGCLQGTPAVPRP